MGKAAEGIAVYRGTMSESLDFIFERANSALITQDFEYAERLLTNVLTKHPDISPEDKEKKGTKRRFIVRGAAIRPIR